MGVKIFGLSLGVFIIKFLWANTLLVLGLTFLYLLFKGVIVVHKQDKADGTN